MDNIKNIVFAGNGHGAIAALLSLQVEFEEIHVLTEDVDVLKRLRSDDLVVDSLDSCKNMLIICAGYSKIISKNILTNNIIINTHPSLLPKYRGVHSLAWAMLNLEDNVGFTVHLMDEWIDNGHILKQYMTKVENKSSREIMDEFDLFVLNNLGLIITQYINGEIHPVKQDFSKATWCCRRNVHDCILNFDISHDEMKATFKTLVEPYPLPILEIKNELYEIIDVEIKEERTQMHTGRVINIQDGRVYLKAKESIIIINEIRDFKSKIIYNASDLLSFGMRLHS